MSKTKLDSIQFCQQLLIGIAKTNLNLINKIIEGKANQWLEVIAKQSGLETPEEVILLLQTSKEFSNL